MDDDWSEVLQLEYSVFPSSRLHYAPFFIFLLKKWIISRLFHFWACYVKSGTLGATPSPLLFTSRSNTSANHIFSYLLQHYEKDFLIHLNLLEHLIISICLNIIKVISICRCILPMSMILEFQQYIISSAHTIIMHQMF